jgi:hypothetical protein
VTCHICSSTVTTTITTTTTPTTTTITDNHNNNNNNDTEERRWRQRPTNGATTTKLLTWHVNGPSERATSTASYPTNNDADNYEQQRPTTAAKKGNRGGT